MQSHEKGKKFDESEKWIQKPLKGPEILLGPAQMEALSINHLLLLLNITEPLHGVDLLARCVVVELEVAVGQDHYLIFSEHTSLWEGLAAQMAV